MKKIVRLSESDLARIVKRVIKESKEVEDMDMERERDMERDMEEYREDFLMKLDFDESEAFPDFGPKYDKFMDKLEDFIIYSISSNISPSKAVSMIKKEPWFKPYIKFTR
jgi:hypothetical protein